MKKLWAIFLTFVMLLSCLSMGVLAVDEEVLNDKPDIVHENLEWCEENGNQLALQPVDKSDSYAVMTLADYSVEVEPNDSVSTADAIYNGEYMGGYAIGYDIDFFKFTLTTRSFVLFDIMSSYSRLGVLIESSSGDAVGGGYVDYYYDGYYWYEGGGYLSAGTYYVCVLNRYSSTTSSEYGTYMLSYQAIPHECTWEYSGTVSPTCTEEGCDVYTCSECGITKAENVVAALGHSFTNYIDNGDGTKTAICDRANCEETDRRDLSYIVNPFTDVKEGEFYYDAVLWAVDNGITTGLTKNTFAPMEGCTRAQVVTFLWRAAGSPAPSSNNNPFMDVIPGEFYYDAVLWAVENGITTGMSSTKFVPNETCTRGQIVTFLWRWQGKPAASSSDNPFKDVAVGEFYYDAVLWAVEEGVTNGLSATKFGPNETCTRGQIVTFLYRTAN